MKALLFILVASCSLNWGTNVFGAVAAGQGPAVITASPVSASPVSASPVSASPVSASPATGPQQDKSTEVSTEQDKTSDSAQKSETEKDTFDPRKNSGILHQIATPLSKILKFKRKNQKLSFDVPTSYSEADAAFREIRSKGRGGGGGHGSGNFWTQYVSSQFFAGRIQRSQQNFGGNQKKRPDSLTVEFMETADTSGSFEVQAENSEEFTIRINGGLAPYYLQVVQGKSDFSVQEVGTGYAFAARAESFEDFCRKNPTYVQNRLLPILKHYGVSSPITRFNHVTRDHVLALLSPADDKALSKFHEAFQGLESSDYEERESATKRLQKEFDQWKDVLRYAAGSDRFSLEVRARLQKLIKEKSSEDDRQLIALVAAGDLPNDAEYLVWLLGQCKPEDQREKQYVAARLEKITNEKFGTDESKWKEYVDAKNPEKGNSNSRQAATSSTTPNLIDVIGYLPQMAEPTANLLRIKLDQNRLKLNREFWAEQFNGESIETLYKRLESQLEKSNLPKKWLNAGGHSLPYVSHEHVLFEHIQSAVPPQRSPNYYSYGNLSSRYNNQLNRSIEQPHLLLGLTREKLKTDEKLTRVSASTNKPNIFRYSARERRDSHLDLSFVEKEDSSLHLTIASWQAQSVFHLAQQANGKIVCHLLVQGHKKSVAADNFQQLYEQNRDFLQNDAYPIFRRFGIQIPKAIGGPLEIKNATPPKSKP